LVFHLSEKHKLHIYENRVLKRIPLRQEVTGFWVVLCGEKLIICIIHQILLEWTNQGFWSGQVIENAWENWEMCSLEASRDRTSLEV